MQQPLEGSKLGNTLGTTYLSWRIQRSKRCQLTEMLGSAESSATPSRVISISNSIAGFFAAVALETSLNLFLRIAAGTIAGFPRESLELGQWHRECAMRGKQIKFQSDSVMANVYLGVTVAGLYTLVGMGLIIVFM
jgi:hypothetical protein